MRYRLLGILAIATAGAVGTAYAASNHSGHDAGSHTSHYAGEEKREIKSLSPDDIAQIKKGAGWGLAKAAELNGVPGPAHLLEMKQEIALSEDQVSAIEAIHADMQKKAIAEGENFIGLEKELELAFQSGKLTDEKLMQMLSAIASSKAKLRYIHLTTHLKTPDILSKKQIALYNKLRGYGDDPCAAVPEGHNAEMWKKHNGCE